MQLSPALPRGRTPMLVLFLLMEWPVCDDSGPKISYDAAHSPATALPTGLLDEPVAGTRARWEGPWRYDAALWWLTASDRIVSDHLAGALLEVRKAGLHRKEGHARWSTYLRAFVGTTPRWCQYEMRRVRQLADYPQLAAAWRKGEIVKSRLRVILGVVKPETESVWVERGRLLSVARLEELAAREPEKRGPEATSEPPAETRRFYRRTVKVPPGVTVIFAQAVEVARKVEGYQVSRGEALSMMAIEMMAGLSQWPDAAGPADEDPPHEKTCAREASFLGDHVALSQIDGAGWRQLHEHFEQIADQWRELGWGCPRVLLSGAPPEDAAPHERVVFWSAAQCRLDAVRGRLLRVVEDRGHAQTMGFAGLGQYVRERMGLSVRQAGELIHLDRVVSRLPVAYRMYAAGRLGKRAARLVAKIATRETDRAWTRYAMTHSLRLLEQAVEAALVKREADPEGWRLDGGLPPVGVSFADLTRTCSLFRQPDGSAQPTSRLAVVLDAEQESLYEQAVAMLRGLYGADQPEWWCLAVIARHFLELYGKLDEQSVPARLRRILSRRVLERDNYTCAAPECLQRGGLEADHTRPRGRGGADAMWNLASLCAVDHRYMKHQIGTLVLHGESPDRLYVKAGRRLYRNDRWLNPDFGEQALDEDPWR